MVSAREGEQLSSHLLRFGVMFCVRCMLSREFVSYDSRVKHITDAFCSECGYKYGRVDQYDELAGLRPGHRLGTEPTVIIHEQPVISDATAAAAAERLGHGTSDMAPEAIRLLAPPAPPWRPGLHATPADGPAAGVPSATEPTQPLAAPSKPAVPRPATVARSDEFLRYFERNGRT